MWISEIQGRYLPSTRYEVHRLVSKGFRSPNGSNHRANHNILFKATRNLIVVQSTTKPEWLKIRETTTVSEAPLVVTPMEFEVETIPVTRGKQEHIIEGENNRLVWFIDNVTKHGGKLLEVNIRNNVFFGVGLFTEEQQEQGIGKQRHLGYGMIINKGLTR